MVKSILFTALGITLTALFSLNAYCYDASSECCIYDDYGSCPNRYWIEADYLYWKVQDSSTVIPLVIEQPLVDGPFEVVLGGKKIKNDWHSGARFALGYWLDDCTTWGIEARCFFLGKRTKHDSVSSDNNGSPRLRVPFFNVNTDLPDSVALATPGLFKAKAFLKTSNKMQGAELNIVRNICWDHGINYWLLAGFRYWNFNDHLKFFADSPLVVIPTIYRNEDKFHTENDFYGGQVGVGFEYQYCSFSLRMLGKVALGAMRQKSKIEGLFVTNEFSGKIQAFEGGYFALPTNISDHKRTHFAVIPELNIDLGYQLTDCARIHIGYSALYASNVLRASKQMSSAINPTQSANIEFTPTPVLVGEPSPQAKFRGSSLWVQGVNLGIDFTF